MSVALRTRSENNRQAHLLHWRRDPFLKNKKRKQNKNDTNKTDKTTKKQTKNKVFTKRNMWRGSISRRTNFSNNYIFYFLKIIRNFVLTDRLFHTKTKNSN